jgi:hypothetical protein
MTTLTDAHKAQVRAWLREGLPLAEVQDRLARELGVRLTYMELKFLVSELEVLPKDREVASPPVTLGAPSSAAPGSRPASPAGQGKPSLSPAASPGAKTPVTVTVDQLARPGAMVSGGVTFSDGKRATWYVDEMGRLSVAPGEPGYRPSSADMQEFQMALERELAKVGF